MLPGRSLDPASNGGARGMIAVRRRRYVWRGKQNSAYGSLRTFPMKKLLIVSFAVLGVAARQTPGQIRPRPAEGREPEFKPPTIRELRKLCYHNALKRVPGLSHAGYTD